MIVSLSYCYRCCWVWCDWIEVLHGMKSVENKAESVRQVFTIGYVVFKYFFFNTTVFAFWDTHQQEQQQASERTNEWGSLESFQCLLLSFPQRTPRDLLFEESVSVRDATAFFFIHTLASYAILFLGKKKRREAIKIAVAIVRILMPLFSVSRAPFLRHFCLFEHTHTHTFFFPIHHVTSKSVICRFSSHMSRE